MFERLEVNYMTWNKSINISLFGCKNATTERADFKKFKRKKF